MNMKKKSSSNFLVQGSILAMASIISRIIGLLYRIPLTKIIGDVGNDYYGCAFEIYNILLIISSYSLPLAVSKLVSAEMTKGRRKNVYRILKCAFLFAVISGIIAGLILFFGAEFITAEIMKTPYSVFAVRILAPTLLVVAVLGVLRGFFQGLGTMMPSAISQILEQVANAIVSIWAAYVLFSYGSRVGAVLGNADKYAAAYGAAGGTLGTNIGALTALIFVAFVFMIYMKVYKKQMKRSKEKRIDPYQYTFKILIITVIPVLLSTAIYNCSSIIDQALFKNIANAQGYSAEEISIWWGKYSGKYKTLINVPISIASALAASSVPTLTAAFTSEKKDLVKSQINTAIRFIMIVAFPCTVGIGVLASPILQMLFGDDSHLAANMLQVGSVSILFFSLSTLSNGLLQGINRMREPVKNATISLIVHIILLCTMMYLLKWNIYAVIYSNAAFGLLMCILNAHSVKKYSGYRQEIVRTFILPAISSVFMGVLVWLSYFLLHLVSKSNTASTLVAMLIGVITYPVAMLLLHGMDETDLRKLPKGQAFVALARKLHLIRA